LCYLSHFLVGDREVHEDFSHDEIQVGHAVDFSYEVGDVLEEFDKIADCHHGVVSVHALGFEFGDFPVEVFDLFELRFEVTHDHASNEYLEQMGSFIAWLVLDVTPASIDWKKDILLGYVEPDQYGPLRTRQEVEAERLKRINAATVFAPQQLVPSEEGQSIVIRGRLRTLVNGFETANDLKAYRVEFSYAGARMHLKSFKEVPNAGN
jgi:type IV conjugative transfer system protein TraE